MSGYEGNLHTFVLVSPYAYPGSDGSTLVLSDFAKESNAEMCVTNTTAEGRYITINGVVVWLFKDKYSDYERALEYQKCKKNTDEPEKFRCYIHSDYHIDSAPDHAEVDLFVNIPPAPEEYVYPYELRNKFFFDVGQFNTVRDFVNYAMVEVIGDIQDPRRSGEAVYQQGIVGNNRLFLATVFHRTDAAEKYNFKEDEDLPFA